MKYIAGRVVMLLGAWRKEARAMKLIPDLAS